MRPMRSSNAAISPQVWGRMLSAAPTVASDEHGWRTALVRRWTGTDADMRQPQLDHHYVVLHLGGPKTVERRGPGGVDRFEVEEGSLTIVPKGTSFEWRTTGPIDFAHLYIHPAMLGRAIRPAPDRQSSGLVLRDGVGVQDRLLAELILGMLAEVERPSAWRTPYLDALFDTAVFHLARHHACAVAEVDTVARHVLAPLRLKRVLDHVDAALADPITLTDLAQVAGLSRFHFSRAFHSAVGEPPLTYVTRRRVEVARDLLRGTELPLSEIARRTGFNSAAYFSTAFKRRTGLNPSLFRQQF